MRLALAVAASSAFPPFLSPVRPRLGLDAYASGRGALTDARYRRRRCHGRRRRDNLGLDTAWKEYETVLSDGGGQYQPQPDVRANWLHQTRRVIGTIDSQVRALRKRQVIGGLAVEPAKAPTGASGADRRLPSADALDVPDEHTKQLAHLDALRGSSTARCRSGS